MNTFLPPLDAIEEWCADLEKLGQPARGIGLSILAEVRRLRACPPSTDLRVVVEAAMHELLHIDASMSERVEAAENVARAIGHPWPPYPGAEEEDDDDDEETDLTASRAAFGRSGPCAPAIDASPVEPPDADRALVDAHDEERLHEAAVCALAALHGGGCTPEMIRRNLDHRHRPTLEAVEDLKRAIDRAFAVEDAAHRAPSRPPAPDAGLMADLAPLLADAPTASCDHPEEHREAAVCNACGERVTALPVGGLREAINIIGRAAIDAAAERLRRLCRRETSAVNTADVRDLLLAWEATARAIDTPLALGFYRAPGPAPKPDGVVYAALVRAEGVERGAPCAGCAARVDRGEEHDDECVVAQAIEAQERNGR